MQPAQNGAPLVQADGEQLASTPTDHLVDECGKHRASDTLPLVGVLYEHAEFPSIRRDKARASEADDVARRAATISYEILTGLPPRLPRRYFYKGKEVGQTDLLCEEPQSTTDS